MRRRKSHVRRVVLSAAVLLSVPWFARASDTYVGPDNGFWSDAANWSDGVPNSSAFDVLIGASSPVTVQLDIDETINNLALHSPNSLALLANLTLSGNSLVNTGTLFFNATAPNPALTFIADATLSGGGTILMTSTASAITGVSGVRLTTDNLITGAGNLGFGLLRITNTGTISAAAGVLSLAPKNATDGFTNVGNLLADGGTLSLSIGTYVNTSGIIKAYANSLVVCTNATIVGGTVAAFPGGTVALTSTSLSDVFLTGQVQAQGVTLAGTVTNAGTLDGQLGFGANGNSTPVSLVNTGLVQASGGGNIYANTTLSGGGLWTLNGASFSTGSSYPRLTTDNIITGYGSLSSAPGILLTNSGEITASGGVLTVNGPGSNLSGTMSSYNTGVLRADLGTLNLNNFGMLGGTNLINTGGTIEARANSVVNLSNDYVVGGTVRSLGSGTVVLSASTLNGVSLAGLVQGTVTLVGTTTNAGTLKVGPLYFGANGNSTPVSLVNTGLVQASGGGNIYANTTLSGGGLWTLNGASFSTGSSYPRLTTDNIITGYGSLSSAPGILLTNSGEITASGGVLTVNGPGSNLSGTMSSYNTGVLRADLGTLNLNNFGMLGGTNLINTGGTIEARANSVVNISNDYVVGGIVRSLGSGTVVLAATTLNGVSLAGLVQGTMTLAGTVTNAGTLKVGPLYFGANGNSTPVTLVNAGLVQASGGANILANTTLSGGGLWTLNGASFAIGSSCLRLTTDNILSGYGNLSGGPGILLTNTGEITASGGVLNVYGPGPLFSGTLSSFNTGVLRADGGTLNLNGFDTLGSANLINTGGTIEARADSVVNLSKVYVVGGIVRSLGSGTVVLAATTLSGVSLAGLVQGTVTLAGTVTNAGTLKAGPLYFGANGNSTPVTLVNTGLVQASGGGNIYANATLSGGGLWTLNGASFSVGGSLYLRLTTDNILSGYGSLSGGPGILLTNSGTITASGGVLSIFGPGAFPSGTLSSYNAGVLRADGGTLHLNNFTMFGGTYLCNTGGTIEARGNSVIVLSNDYVAGGTVRALSGGTVSLISTNLAGATIGGLLQAASGISTIIDCSGNPGTLRADGGTLVLTGASVTNSGTIEARNGGRVSLKTRVNGGTLSLASGGTLGLDAADAIGSGSTIVFNGGFLQYSAGNVTDYTPRFSQASGPQYAIDTNDQTVSFSTPLNSTGSTFTKVGTGTLTLNVDNRFDQGVNFNGGVLRVDCAGALGTAGTMTFAGGILQYTAANSTDYSARFSTAAGQLYAIDTNGQPVTFGTPLASDGANLTKLGDGTLVLAASANYSGPTTIAAGTLDFGGTGVSHSIASVSGTGSLAVAAGTILTSDGVYMPMGSLTIAGTQTIRSNATTSIAYPISNATTPLAGTSKVSSLIFNSTASGQLDLTDNGLIIESANTTSKLALLPTIVANSRQISNATQSFFNITSSTAINSAANYTLAVADVADLPGRTYFGGLPVTVNSIVVTEAIQGDANLDGTVNFVDYQIWLKSNTKTTSSYARGDFNGDGKVNFVDYQIWLKHNTKNIGSLPIPFDAGTGTLGTGGGLGGGGQAGSGLGGAVSAVPEPASLAGLGIGALLLLPRRRRR